MFSGIPYECLLSAKNSVGLIINARPEARSSNRNVCLLFSLLCRAFWHQQSSCVNQFFFSYREQLIKMSQDSRFTAASSSRETFTAKSFQSSHFVFHFVFDKIALWVLFSSLFKLETSYLDNGFSSLSPLITHDENTNENFSFHFANKNCRSNERKHKTGWNHRLSNAIRSTKIIKVEQV